MNEKASSYHMTMVMPSVTESVDFVKPDRLHMVMPKSQTEMTMIGKRGWMREGGGGWKPAPMVFDMSQVMAMSKALVEKNRAGDTCVDAGMGLWHGQPAHLFKGTHVSAKGTSMGTIYVLSDGYVHHIDASGKQGPITIDFTNFNSTSINPPI